VSYLSKALISSIAPTNIGKVRAVVGNTITVSGLNLNIGSKAKLNGNDIECIGFDGNGASFVSIGHMGNVKANDLVYLGKDSESVKVPVDLAGEVLDSYGSSLINQDIEYEKMSLGYDRVNPMSRPSIRLPLDVGINTINTFTSIGRGQRIGIMAGTGVGKSTILGMIAKYTDADYVIINLVGERSREVNDFINDNLTESTKGNTTMVVSTADSTPIEKVRSATLAMSIAEKKRDEGKNVLLLMDSMTRYANAYRDIYISGGELPTNRGYPPSVYSKIYDLVERAGNFENGSITAMYTILLDGDSINDPVADHSRGIMDGHIVLSRDIANAGIYPAIDISKSISRIMPNITMKDHQEKARYIKSIYNTYSENKDLISMGYEKGSDPEIDLAIEYRQSIKDIMIQSSDDRVSLADSLNKLRVLYDEIKQKA
jgi:flagellum-specific ATP synthase